MNTPTYAEQFNKITGAYMRDELRPEDSCACFIGNLLNNRWEWAGIRRFKELAEFEYDITKPIKKTRDDWGYMDGVTCIKIESFGIYNSSDIINMENNFLTIWVLGKKTEDSLFNAMSSTLDMLRELHISKGENVDAIPFTKRELVS